MAAVTLRLDQRRWPKVYRDAFYREYVAARLRGRAPADAETDALVLVDAAYRMDFPEPGEDAAGVGERLWLRECESTRGVIPQLHYPDNMTDLSREYWGEDDGA